MKKRLLLLLLIILIFLFVDIGIAQISIPKNINEFKNKDIIAISSSPIQESQDSISIPHVYSARTSGYTLSNAKDVNIDKATGGMSAKSGDMLIINQLDAEQLKDANLRNRILTLQGAGAVHIKDPILIDLDEIGPSTFWFEGNDLRAMEITFPKKKHYLINNPLTNDESFGLDIEHMLDSDKDGITDEVERLRNLNPFAKDTDNDGLNDDVELLNILL